MSEGRESDAPEEEPSLIMTAFRTRRTPPLKIVPAQSTRKWMLATP